jgi:hypothetical protein
MIAEAKLENPARRASITFSRVLTRAPRLCAVASGTDASFAGVGRKHLFCRDRPEVAEFRAIWP